MTTTKDTIPHIKQKVTQILIKTLLKTIIAIQKVK